MATCTSGLNALAGKTARRKVEVSTTDALLGITFVWCSLPETLVGDADFYDVPLRFCLFYGTVTCCLISTLVSGMSRVTPYMKMALVAMLFMAAQGLLNGNDLKFWVIDASGWTALIFGLYWGGRFSRQRTLNTLYWWSAATSIVLLLNIVGLLLGIVPQAGEGSRLYSYSLFTSSAFVTSMFPLWFTADASGKQLAIPPRARLMAIVGIGSVLFCSMLTATRSMFLTAMVALSIVLWLRLHGRNAVFSVLVVLASSIIVAAYFFSGEGLTDAVVTERLSSTDIAEEYRFVELQMMFAELEGSFLTGKGFGSRFESCIGKHGDFLAFAPHIAIFTSLFKGGVIVFAMLFVLPFGSSVYNLVRLNGNAMSLSCSAAVVLYCAQASMSGGWNFVALFLFGAALTLTSRCQLQKSTPSFSPRS